VIDTQDDIDGKPPIIWPWIAMIVLMVIVAGTIIFAMVRGPEPTASPTPSQSATPTPTETASPSPSPTPTDPNTVIVLSSDIFGMNLEAASAYLQGLGLNVESMEGLVVPADDGRVLTVYDATPLGTLAKGDTITLIYYIADQPVDDGTGN
jgi:serine/threonine-protein kinase